MHDSFRRKLSPLCYTIYNHLINILMNKVLIFLLIIGVFVATLFIGFYGYQNYLANQAQKQELEKRKDLESKDELILEEYPSQSGCLPDGDKPLIESTEPTESPEIN